MNEYNTVVGMDLGDKHNHYCVLNANGEIEQEGRVACTEAGLNRTFGAFEPSLFAIEAGTHSAWVSRLLESMGHKVLVANPRKVRAIYTNDRKNDAVDARMLARMARMDPELLHPITHRTAETQAHLAIIRSRDRLVETRTKLINHVRGTVKAFGQRLPSASAPAFHDKALKAMPPELRPALIPILDIIGQLTQTIKDFDKDIEKMCEQNYPETEVLRGVSGVGPVSALTFVLTLETPERFARSRDVAAYIGLAPRRSQSGESDPQLPISKSGNLYLRRLLVGCAQYILGPHGPDTALRQWGERLMARGGKNAKKRAVVAVARKLAVLLHALWCSGMLYEPFPNAPRKEALNSPTETGPAPS